MTNDDKLIDKIKLDVATLHDGLISPDDCAERIIKLIRDSDQINSFRNFTDDILEIASNGDDADGATIQELAEKHGLVELTTVHKSCSEGCVCAETLGFPCECYRRVE